MARYPLVGGPCAGQQSINFTVRPPLGYIVVCQTHEYAFGADARFHDRGVAPILQGGGSLDTKQVDRAWRGLMRVYAVEARAAIRRSQAGRARLRRRVR